MLGLFWFIVSGALACAFWGVVLAFFIRWIKELDRLPRWPILASLVLGAGAGALIYLSY